METNFLAIDPLLEVKRILDFMEFDINKIHFDNDDRQNKYPLTHMLLRRYICILYKKVDLQGIP